MRRHYLVCYDICNPKRLRRVHKVLKGYGVPWQLSVFFCVLKNIDVIRLKADLEKEMNLKEDQTMIIDLGRDGKEIMETAVVLGKPINMPESGMVVV